MDTISIQKSDQLGAIFSALCLVHCLATPFLFIARSSGVGHTCGAGAPLWWGAIDFLFLALALLAVWTSAKNTSKTWLKYAFGIGWLALLFVIVNERWHIVGIPGLLNHVPALTLISLHIYSLKYCQCKETECCATSSNNTQLSL